jgi:hypothetical protein
MRVKKIKNVSDHMVKVDLGQGTTVNLPPKQEIQNVRVENVSDLREQCRITSDLGEIVERRTGKNRLNG